MNNPYPAETGGCPRFVPEPWNEKKLYWDQKLMYYTTCPTCAKHYGKTYVVILAEV